MLTVSAILQQATEILTGKAEDVVLDASDAGPVLNGEFVGTLPLDDPGALFAHFEIDEGLPFDPSVLSAASDVLSGRGG